MLFIIFYYKSEVLLLHRCTWKVNLWEDSRTLVTRIDIKMKIDREMYNRCRRKRERKIRAARTKRGSEIAGLRAGKTIPAARPVTSGSSCGLCRQKIIIKLRYLFCWNAQLFISFIYLSVLVFVIFNPRFILQRWHVSSLFLFF